MKRIININDVVLDPRPPQFAATGDAADRFDARMGQVGSVIGAEQIGCNITAVAPGKRAFPFHNHQVNEEMFFVLEGTGEIRIGKETFPLRQGDIVACPAGGRDTAHQIINNGDSELRYLALSTRRYPEICEYPDSDKFGVMANTVDADGEPRMFRVIGREADGLDYWEGE